MGVLRDAIGGDGGRAGRRPATDGAGAGAHPCGRAAPGPAVRASGSPAGASGLPAATSGSPAGMSSGAGPPAGGKRSEFRRRRDALAEQVTELHWDLGASPTRWPSAITSASTCSSGAPPSYRSATRNSPRWSGCCAWKRPPLPGTAALRRAAQPRRDVLLAVRCDADGTAGELAARRRRRNTAVIEACFRRRPTHRPRPAPASRAATRDAERCEDAARRWRATAILPGLRGARATATSACSTMSWRARRRPRRRRAEGRTPPRPRRPRRAHRTRAGRAAAAAADLGGARAGVPRLRRAPRGGGRRAAAQGTHALAADLGWCCPRERGGLEAALRPRPRSRTLAGRAEPTPEAAAAGRRLGREPGRRRIELGSASSSEAHQLQRRIQLEGGASPSAQGGRARAPNPDRRGRGRRLSSRRSSTCS